MMTAYRHVGKVSMLAAVATALLVCTGAVGAAGQAAVGDKVLALAVGAPSGQADKVQLAKHRVTDVPCWGTAESRLSSSLTASERAKEA